MTTVNELKMIINVAVTHPISNHDEIWSTTLGVMVAITWPLVLGIMVAPVFTEWTVHCR